MKEPFLYVRAISGIQPTYSWKRAVLAMPGKTSVARYWPKLLMRVELAPGACTSAPIVITTAHIDPLHGHGDRCATVRTTAVLTYLRWMERESTSPIRCSNRPASPPHRRVRSSAAGPPASLTHRVSVRSSHRTISPAQLVLPTVSGPVH